MRGKIIWGLGLAVPVAIGSCTVRQPPNETYFDRVIEPTLVTSCARGPTGGGCHVADAKGNAFGNLDASTFAGVNRRRDLLQTYGPYDVPAILLKTLPPRVLNLTAYDGTSVTLTSDIRHTGGPIFDPTGSAYMVLKRWIDNGATANNTGTPPSKPQTTLCNATLPSSSFDLSVDPPDADFAMFRDRVARVLKTSCAAGNCHGSPANDLQLTCGDTPQQVRFNFHVSVQYLSPNSESSELLRRPLAPSAGGSFHEGGVLFESMSNDGWQVLHDWVRAHGPPPPIALGPGFDFFAHRVQPVLVRKGCMQMQCHSASSFHDYRLRGGSGGSFSQSATVKNYQLSVAQLALESDDPAASRLVRKNLYRPEVSPGGRGIAHRGGPLLEDIAAPDTNAACDAGKYDYQSGSLDDIPAYCVLREWLHREQAARPVLTPLSAIVYVRRALTAAPDSVLDFDLYAPNSDLRMVAVISQNGQLVPTNDRSLMSACGLDPQQADVKRPAINWNGTRIAFAVRTAQTAPLRLYEAKSDGTSCAPMKGVASNPLMQNGLFVHDFDPAYSPPDAQGRDAIVFASTRGNLDATAYDYAGPQRTPADPTRPNADLYVWETDPHDATSHRIRQLTYLLNTERAPSFMSDGRVIFTTEKRMPGFYQLSLRRINLDGGDYHPLYGQRGSIGFREVTQVVHLGDKNFAAIFADRGAAHRGGALGVFNRSIGVDFGSTSASDYPSDPAILDPNSASSPESAFFLHSLRFPHPSPSGRYSSPAPLPDGRMLASFDSGTAGDYDVYVVDPVSGVQTKVFGVSGQAEIEAVAVYGRPVRAIYKSQASEPNAYAMSEGDPTAEVMMHDVPVIASLLLQNTPSGRLLDPGITSLGIYEDLPPTSDVTSFATGGAFVVSDDFGQVYVRRRLLGTVPIQSDGSARFRVPGGLPLVVKLPDTALSVQLGLPRVLHEHFMLTPGERVHEALPRSSFNSFCAGCHGATTARAVDAALRPDVLSGASQTQAFSAQPTDLFQSPSQRGAITGP